MVELHVIFFRYGQSGRAYMILRRDIEYCVFLRHPLDKNGSKAFKFDGMKACNAPPLEIKKLGRLSSFKQTVRQTSKQIGLRLSIGGLLLVCLSCIKNCNNLIIKSSLVTTS